MSTEQNYNTEKMSELCDHIIRILKLTNEHKDTYLTNKDEMLKIVKFSDLRFYDKYPRICRTLVYEDDIEPLIGMIQTFGKVQAGVMSFEHANNAITGAINAKYIDPVINSEELVKERERKQKMSIIE